MPAYNELLGSVPQSLEHWANLLRQASTPCTCKEHDPRGYIPTLQCNHGEFLLVPHVHYLRNSHVPVAGQRYEALDLVGATIRYLSRPEEALTDTQAAALTAWRSLDWSHGGVLQRLGYANGAKAVANSEMMLILNIFNDLFFCSSLVDLVHKWDSESTDAYGSCHEEGKGHIIALSATYTEDPASTEDLSTCKASALFRLGTLLHECVHAYLSQFACETCRRY